ncbi:MAG: sigma-54 dependent transcriptional regulator [Nitrospiraceae bacterium]|nr:sigma-54 dependent transcriptional regulator [Nitrospiraceae bacterium]
MPKVLIVDDEANIRESLADILSDEGYEIGMAGSGEEALEAIRRESPEIVLLDIWLPGMDGVEALKQIKAQHEDLPVVMITGHGTIELAVKTTKMGAYDFMQKPLSIERVLLTVKRALERSCLEKENRTLKETAMGSLRLVGDSAAINALREQVELAAKSSSKVLITGESGSGKELVARLLHELSPRKEMPFVELNCAAIPQELIESELFGHEKGSFTGAQESRRGKFELADTGSFFLDEVGDMSLTTQAKVLRAIETQEFQRVGGAKKIKVDVRVIAATNKDLAREVKNGAFREDLYYRLNVIPIEMPPLRNHRDDIPALVDHFLKSLAAEYGRSPKDITKEAMKKLSAYPWPGNVRELRNVVERLVIMGTSEIIEEGDLLFLGQQQRTDDYFGYGGLKEAKDAFERDYLAKKLSENNWNISKTAEALGVERSNLHRKIKSYGIDVPRGTKE